MLDDCLMGSSYYLILLLLLLFTNGRAMRADHYEQGA